MLSQLVCKSGGLFNVQGKNSRVRVPWVPAFPGWGVEGSAGRDPAVSSPHPCLWGGSPADPYRPSVDAATWRASPSLPSQFLTGHQSLTARACEATPRTCHYCHHQQDRLRTASCRLCRTPARQSWCCRACGAGRPCPAILRAALGPLGYLALCPRGSQR